MSFRKLAAPKTGKENPVLSVIYKSAEFPEGIPENMPDAVVTTDGNFIITGLNKVSEIIYGEPSANIIGKSFFSVVKFEVINEKLEDVLATLTGSGNWCGDVKYFNDGNTLIFHTRCSAVKDGHGNVSSYIFCNQNISEQVRREKELARAEYKYHTLVESLSEGVVLIHANGAIGTINKRAGEILGLSPDELTGRMVASSLWNAVKEDGTEFPLEEFPAAVTLNTGEEKSNVIMGVKKTNGERVWLSVNSRPIFKTGIITVPEAVVASFTDITEIINARIETEKANERYYYAVSAGSSAIWDLDMSTKTIYRSETFSHFTGYPPEEIEPTLEWFEQKVHPDDKERLHCNIEQCLKNNATHWENEYQFRVADGSYRHFLDSACAIYENEKLVRVIGNMQDITKSKELDAMHFNEKVQKQKSINQATITAQENERNRISAELHDNVNQILMTVKMQISAAKNCKQGKDELLDTAGSYLIMAVEEIRALSKQLSSGIISKVGLARSIGDIAGNMKLAREIEVKCEISEETVAKLSPEKQLMVYRIVQEQTNNILKYSGAANASICLSDDAGLAQLDIADNGKGFDKQTQKSTGIGFINIFSRVDAYNGNAQINSSPGNGCRLSISFPL
jgi:PAS domain S-box-containing protein